jgi:periplasmic protein CpxP/Spy
MKETYYCLMRAGVLAVGLALAAPGYAQMGGGMGGGQGGMGGGMMGGQQGTGSGMMGGQQGLGGATQQRGGATEQQEGSEAGAQQMSGIMHHMADQLMQLARQMSKGEMAAATRQRTQEQMWEIAMMIERLSDMMGKDIATHPDMQRQIDEMRQRMQQMRQASGAR